MLILLEISRGIPDGGKSMKSMPEEEKKVRKSKPGHTKWWETGKSRKNMNQENENQQNETQENIEELLEYYKQAFEREKIAMQN